MTLEKDLEIMKLREALKEISLGKGTFSRDNFEHARNCIEDMKALAIEALSTPTPPLSEQLKGVVEALEPFAMRYDSEKKYWDEHPPNTGNEILFMEQSLSIFKKAKDSLQTLSDLGVISK